MIVVKTKSRVFGPFRDANSAFAWIETAHRSIAISDGFPTVCRVESPNGLIADWSEAAPDTDDTQASQGFRAHD